MEDSWGEKLERLSVTRHHYHNDDYLEFLVDRVWKLHSPSRLVDIGCGFGYLGGKLLPLLPVGSTYTGVDSSPKLLDQARSIFSNAPWKTEFIQADICNVPLPDGGFDVALSDGLGASIDDDHAEQMRQRFIARGFAPEEAEREVHRAQFQARKFEESGPDFHIVSPLLMMFGYGEVP